VILEDGRPGLPEEQQRELEVRARARRVGCLLGFVVFGLAGSVILWKVWLQATAR